MGRRLSVMTAASEFKLAIMVTGRTDDDDEEDAELDVDDDDEDVHEWWWWWWLSAAPDDLCSSRLPLLRAPSDMAAASSLIVLMSELEYLEGAS